MMAGQNVKKNYLMCHVPIKIRMSTLQITAEDSFFESFNLSPARFLNLAETPDFTETFTLKFLK